MILRAFGADSGESAAGPDEKDAWPVLMAACLCDDPLYLLFLSATIFLVEIFPPCDFRKLPE